MALLHPARRRRSRFTVGLALLAVLLSCGLVVLTAPAASADGPGVGTPWVVTLGDSYISGEAGRWAESSNASSSPADALGPTAYYDNASGTAEQIDRCHRSKASEAYVGGGVDGLDLACSGGRQGQALMLPTLAASHNVTMVAVSIGGNDFNFASIVQQCVTASSRRRRGGRTTARTTAR